MTGCQTYIALLSDSWKYFFRHHSSGIQIGIHFSTNDGGALYIDYLISSFGASAATGLPSSVGGISHDKITRMLSLKPGTSAELRSVVKPLIRQSEKPDGVPITDDSIPEKPPTDGNDIICRHHDHRSGRSVKGISFMTAMYHRQKAVLPAGFRIAAETEYHTAGGKEKRRCKNCSL